MGRENARNLEGSMVLLNSALLKDVLDKIRKSTEEFCQFLVGRVHHQQPRPPKWGISLKQEFKPNDTVLSLFQEGNLIMRGSTWKPGKMMEVENHKPVVNYHAKHFMQDPPSRSSVVRGWRDVAILFSEDVLYFQGSISRP